MDAVDEIYKAIAHPVRRELIAMLAGEAMSVKQLTAAFAMSQPAVSQHLRELREAGLVTAERAGVEQRYRLTGAPLRQVYEWSGQYRRFFDPAGHAWTFVKAKTPGGSGHGD